MSKKEIVQFTSVLSELLSSDMTLRSALEIMSDMTGLRRACALAASEIKSYLAEGSRFSIALKKCQSLSFDDVYIAFVCSAEKSGNLEKTMEFLKKREEGKSNRSAKLLAMCAYPMFVILVTFVGGIVLSSFATQLVADLSGTFDFVAYKKSVASGCVQANFFLAFAAFVLIKLLQNLLNKNIRLDIFRILDFMSESGIGFYSALETSLLLAEKNVKVKNEILSAMEDVSLGKKIGESVGNFGKDFKLYAQVAENSGDLGKVFKQICSSLESKFSRLEKICMDLTSPVIISVAGIYIIILLKKVVMPVLFTINF